MDTANYKLSASHALGAYVEQLRFDALPETVVNEAKKRIAELVAIGLSGSATCSDGIISFCKENGAQGNASIWGSRVKASAPYAALANGTMAFRLELDDVHRTSHTHPGVSCIPAAIAMGEELSCGGREIIEAVVAGYDACIRVGMAVSPSIYVDRTYLAPGTLSGIGAAAATAKLMKMDAETAGKTIGAVSYFGPLAAYEAFKLGAGIKDVIMGWGNLCGINAAKMAALGFGGPESALDGDFGYCKTVSRQYDISRLYNGLGSVYEIMNTGVKPYACCRQHHAAIDCILGLREKYGLRIKDVEKIKVRTFVVSSRGNNKEPDSIPAAKYSIPYIMAVALRYGEVWREQFTEELLGDGELSAMAKRVEVVPDYELDKLYDEKWPSIVEVTLKDGTLLTERKDIPKGEPEFACSLEDTYRKFISLACNCVQRPKAQEIWDFIMRLDECENINELTRMLEK